MLQVTNDCRIQLVENGDRTGEDLILSVEYLSYALGVRVVSTGRLSRICIQFD